MKIFEKIKIEKEREIRIFGIAVLQYGKKTIPGGTERYVKLFPTSFEKKILKNIIKRYPLKHTVYLNRHGMGETWVLANMLKGQNDISVICSRKYGREIFNLFCKDIDVFTDKLSENFYRISNKPVFSYKGRRFINYLPRGYFKKLYNNDYCKKKWIDEIVKFYGFNKENFSRLSSSSAFCIQNDNTVLICPDALSIKSASIEFWNKLKLSLSQKGFGVFVNSSKNGKLLPLQDICAMAAHCKAIIGLRSGLLDILSSLSKEVPFYILYNKHSSRNVDMLQAHTLKSSPLVDKANIFEYDLSNETEDEILNKIMENLR